MSLRNSSIGSITAGPRQSNFELLRIVAMILVLVLHADFLSLGGPGKESFIEHPVNAWSRTFLEACAIVAVNVFVLISGWFGIKPSIKGFLNFIFQCVYFYSGIYIVMVLTGRIDFSIYSFLKSFLLIDSNWFVISYIGLYLISPLLNVFLKDATQQQLLSFLIVFYIFQSFYGWIGPAYFVAQGYSTFSFIGLYILGNYIKKYGSPFSRYSFATYFGCSIAVSILFLGINIFDISINIFAYVNPIIILASLSIVITFSKIRVKRFCKSINWIAKSAFAVFLLHINPYILEPIYEYTCKSIYNSQSGIMCLFTMLCFIVLTFIAGILIDQPRKMLFRLLSQSALVDKLHINMTRRLEIIKNRFTITPPPPRTISNCVLMIYPKW